MVKHNSIVDLPLVVVFDCETTGLLPRQGHRIIEIAAIKLIDGQVGDVFQSLIDCGRSVPLSVQRINGITDSMLLGQPKPEIVFRQFLDFIGNAMLIAHNADFDHAFIRSELGRLGWQIANPMRCTLDLSRRKLPGLPDYRLETVFRHLFPGEIEGLTVHRAQADAWMAGRVWVALGVGE